MIIEILKLFFLVQKVGMYGRWIGPMFTSKNICFVGVQHGLIDKNNYAYKHDIQEVNPHDYCNVKQDPNYYITYVYIGMVK